MSTSASTAPGLGNGRQNHSANGGDSPTAMPISRAGSGARHGAAARPSDSNP